MLVGSELFHPHSAEELVRVAVAEVVGCGPAGVDLDQRFAELGVDSFTAIRLLRSLKRLGGVELPLTAFLGDRAVRSVVDDIEASPGVPRNADAPVPFVTEADDAPLTAIQGAYWAGRCADFADGAVAAFWYHEYDRADSDLDRLEEAWNRLVAWHPMLRATIGRDGRQRVDPIARPYRIDRVDLREARPEDVQAALTALRHECSHQVRPTDRWPLFDVRAALLPGGTVRLFVGFDVLILDFTSWRLLMSQWGTLVDDLDARLPMSPTRFVDIVAGRETDPSYQDRKSRDRAYWLERIEEIPDGPRLPLVARDSAVARRFHRHVRTLDAAAWGALRARAAEQGLSPTSVLLAAFGVALGRWGATERFSLNTTLFDRPEDVPGVEHLVGDFTTTALVAMPELDPLGWRGFADYARSVNHEFWSAIDHRSFSGVEVLRELRTGKDHRVVFTSGLGIGDGQPPAGWLGTEVYGVSQTPQVLIDHLVWDEDGGVRLVWDAVVDELPAGFVDGLADAQLALLRRLADEATTWTAVDLGWDPTFDRPRPMDVAPFGDVGPLLVDPIRAAAAAHPDALALVGPGGPVGHAELSARARRVAESLAARGVSAGDLVLVAFPKCVAQVVAVLGTQERGAGYVPVDPSWPAARIDSVCRQAGITVALVPRGVRVELPDGVRAVVLDDSGCPTDASAREVGSSAVPTDLAYVIFTSGSTGTPKGVAIEHHQARTTVDDITDRFGITSTDRVLGLSALSFDLSVYDIFGVLGAGGALVLPSAERQRDPAHWCELVEEHGVTVWNTAPPLLEMLVEYAEGDPGAARRLRALRLVMLSGDWIPVTLPDRLRALVPGARVMSLGGATEASIWSITYPIGEVDPAWPSIPYGRPLRGQAFHVLDEDGRPCPVGVPGELFIGGGGVARGYIGDHEQTAARFAVHPVLGERLYRTGDLGSRRIDGAITFLGRTDRQVKVRGHRIELGEIESALDRLPQVRQAVASSMPGPDGRPRLVAHVVLATAVDDAARALATALADRLPDYMVPTRFVLLDAFPVTDNGKLDHKALPNPFLRARPVEPAADPGSLDAVLRGILGPRADFASGLVQNGATSLDVVRLANLIEDSTGARPSFQELVEFASIHDLLAARQVQQAQPAQQVKPAQQAVEPDLDLALRLLGDVHRWADQAGYRVSGSLLPGGDDLVEVRLRLRDHAVVPSPRGTAQIPLAQIPMAQLPVAQTGDAFALTEMQLAYLVGRADTWLGDPVAPHYYTEVDVLDLDVDRFVAALELVVDRHPMLRASITPDTTQVVGAHRGPLPVEVFDWRDLTPADREAALLRLRERRSHRVSDPMSELMAHLVVSRVDGRTSRVHFGLDLLFCDARSAALIADELRTAYRDPSALAPVPTARFQEWVNRRAEAVGSDRHVRARRYWQSAATELADGPALPVRAPADGRVRFARRRAVLDRAQWSGLKDRIRARGLTPAAVLLSGFGDVLRAGGGGDHFSLVVTSIDRPADHEGVVGDYTSTLVLDVRPTGSSARSRAAGLQRRLWTDLEHSTGPAGVHGNEVLRELAGHRGRRVLLPIVFSSGLDGARTDASHLLDAFGRTVYAISQTPHVLLDNQVFEADGELRINWDAVEGAFPIGYLDRMFAAYVDLLRALVDDRVWDLDDPADLADRGLSDAAAWSGTDPTRFVRPSVVRVDPELESRIASVLADVLGGVDLDVTSSFFDLGATSLTLVRAHRDLREVCGERLTVLDLFAHPSVRALAAHVAQRSAPEPVQKVGDPLTAARERGRRRAEMLAAR